MRNGRVDAPDVNRAALRATIAAVLPTDADFNAFCLDSFEQVYRRFSVGMDRLTKVTLLLEICPPPQVLTALQTYTGNDADTQRLIAETVRGLDKEDVRWFHEVQKPINEPYLPKDVQRAALEASELESATTVAKRGMRRNRVGHIQQLQGRSQFSKRWTLTPLGIIVVLAGLIYVGHVNALGVPNRIRRSLARPWPLLLDRSAEQWPSTYRSWANVACVRTRIIPRYLESSAPAPQPLPKLLPKRKSSAEDPLQGALDDGE